MAFVHIWPSLSLSRTVFLYRLCVLQGPAHRHFVLEGRAGWLAGGYVWLYSHSPFLSLSAAAAALRKR